MDNMNFTAEQQAYVDSKLSALQLQIEDQKFQIEYLKQ